MLDQPAVELHDVTKTYPGPVRALNHTSFAVHQGERCCLLGPNGAGKTTIVKLLEGALSAESGRISILGAEVDGQDWLRVKSRVGIVPQSPGMYPDLTVREYLTFVSRLYGKGDVELTASTYGLHEYIDRRTSALSGGYQRRLLVAAAVLSGPDLLILDEPTVGLDPLAATQVRGLLREAMRGRAVLMSTHNLAEAEELCETVIILRTGEVLIHERIEDLRRQTAPRVYLQAAQGVQALQAALTDMGLGPAADERRAWIVVEDPVRRMPDVLRGLLSRGIDVYSSSIAVPSLEDLFVDLVTRI